MRVRLAIKTRPIVTQVQNGGWKKSQWFSLSFDAIEHLLSTWGFSKVNLLNQSPSHFLISRSPNLIIGPCGVTMNLHFNINQADSTGSPNSTGKSFRFFSTTLNRPKEASPAISYTLKKDHHVDWKSLSRLLLWFAGLILSTALFVGSVSYGLIQTYYCFFYVPEVVDLVWKTIK